MEEGQMDVQSVSEQVPVATGVAPQPVFRDRPSGARALVTGLGVGAYAGLTLIAAYVLDVFLGPDQEGALGVVILGVSVLFLCGVPLVVVLLLPWWQRAVAASLRAEGLATVIGILKWSAGACGLGMLYALRYLAHNPGDWHDVLDEEVTLIPLLSLIGIAFFAMAAGAGWAKVLARIVFLVFFLPWTLYNPLGSIVGLGIMFFGLRALRDVQPAAPALASGSVSPPRA